MGEQEFIPVQLTTDWGFEYFYKCPTCAAIVNDIEPHKRWHEKLRAAIGVDELGRKSFERMR